MIGDAILIQTRITTQKPHGRGPSGSVIGESAFCRGGKTSGGSEGPTLPRRSAVPTAP